MTCDVFPLRIYNVEKLVPGIHFEIPNDNMWKIGSKGMFGRVCTGTGTVGVPTLPKLRVPVLRSYRTYRSVEYRY